MAYVWQISVVQFRKKSLVSGVVLSGKYSAKNNRSKKMIPAVIDSYFKKPFTNKQLILISGTERMAVVTDGYGAFTLEVDHHVNEIIVIIKGETEPLEIVQSYPLVFSETDYPVNIISDVDDTILVSYTASAWKRIATIFVSPDKRKPISFTKDILGAVSNRKGSIYYVSKSESNLFYMLSSFIQNHKLPEGILFLTHYLRWNQLLRPKKGKDYKELIISTIIEHTHERRFVLMGDDTQQDMAVYAKIAEQFPDRIIKIYIRKTRKNLLGQKKELLDLLNSMPVPVLYFSDGEKSENEINFITQNQNQ